MTYTYRCPKCLHVQEEEHSMKVDPEITCIRCGCLMTKVIQGGSGYIFPMPTRRITR